MKLYFELQYKRFTRSLKEAGVNPYVGIVLIFCAFIGFSVLFFKRVSSPHYSYPLLVILLLFPLGNIKRNEFLKSIFTRQVYLKVRLLENLFLTIPFFIVLLVQHTYLIAFVLLLGSALCSLYNKADQSGFVIPSPFSKRPFEFTTGFRKTYWLLILLYIVTYIGLWVDNFNLGVITLLGILIVCMTYYSDPEPVFYVWIHAQSPRLFLQNKIKTAIAYSLILSLPIALPLVIFYPLKAYLALIVLVIGLLYVILCVIGKYTNYPNEINLLQVLKIGFGVLCPPALVLLIPHFYAQSVKKLTTYLR